ncbi:MAG: hypothetical protein D6732_24675 [Methanobacteriota archaeon]|nr:MAG: hypothetical protein D6732_24675 [Euryarchaeota archaeon]
MACLASRFPTGTRITADRLHQIERAEYFLKDLGFTQIRVRYHGELARIEIGQEEFEKFLDEDIRKKVNHFMNSLGFKFVTLDLAGYRRGSLNHIQSGKEISYDEHQ